MKECEKCGYRITNKKIINGKEIFLCSVCSKFVPEDKLEKYLSEKIDWRLLETFRIKRKN